MARETVYDKVSTPEALERMILGVKKGIYTSLIIVGRGGTGKSTLVRRHFPENDEFERPARDVGAFWRSGRVSAVKFYEHLYTFRDYTIVLDDAPNMARNLQMAGLMRQLCETEETRRISWDTQNPYLQKMEVPNSFTTRSKFIMITNRWMDRHEEVEALETRCPIVKYDPGVQLIHEKAKTLGYDKQVVAYVEAAIKEGRVHHLNFRDYVNACRRMRNGDEWKSILEQQFLPDAIDDLSDDMEYLRGWAVRSGKPTFTTAEVFRSTKRFRDDRRALEAVLRSMVEEGLLVRVEPPARPRTGRPATDTYRLPVPVIKAPLPPDGPPQKSRKSRNVRPRTPAQASPKPAARRA